MSERRDKDTNENIPTTKPPPRRSSAWLLVFAGWFTLLVEMIVLGNFMGGVNSRTQTGLMLMTAALFGVSCLCFLRCAWRYWMAKGILAVALLGECVLGVGVFRGDFGMRGHGSASSCLANLKQIEGAKATWALEEHKTTNDIPRAADLYGGDRYIRVELQCPLGGVYTIGRMDVTPRCSVEGHSLD